MNRLPGKSPHLNNVSLMCCALLFLCSDLSYSQAQERLHFLIPGGAGGGWDTTARGVGEALTRSNIIKGASYENRSGGDGSKAIAYLIETASRQSNTLMVSSTPIVLRSLKNTFPQSYKDLTPVATIIADYGAFVVSKDSKYQNWQSVLDDYNQDPRNVRVAGGSVIGGMDHIVFAMALMKSGANPKTLRYIPYNAGAKAMVGLLSNETQILSTGLSEALALSQQGEVKILAITAATPPENIIDAPTLLEQGIDMVFTNWRGFFAAPGTTPEKLVEINQLLKQLYGSSEWEAIRNQRGWSNLYISGKDFIDFLKTQEQEMALLIETLEL